MAVACLHTFIGNRTRQEDSALFCGTVVASNSSFLHCNNFLDYRVFCVCDGIGSLASGHEFSKFVCECVLGADHEAWTDITSAQDEIEKIQALVVATFDVKGGTTLTIGCISLDDLFIINAGNSRAYLLRSNELSLLSYDHTYANELVQRGMIDRSELATHHLASYLSFGIGTAFSGNWSKSKIDFAKESLTPGDYILLCTDGCYNEISEKKLIDFMQLKTTIDAATRLDLFWEHGPDDNMTAIVISI